LWPLRGAPSGACVCCWIRAQAAKDRLLPPNDLIPIASAAPSGIPQPLLNPCWTGCYGIRRANRCLRMIPPQIWESVSPQASPHPGQRQLQRQCPLPLSPLLQLGRCPLPLQCLLRRRPDRLQCPHPLLHLLQLVSQPSLSPHSPSTNPCFPPSIGPLLLLPPPPLPKTPRPVSWNACAKSGNAWGRTRPKKKGSLRIP